MAVRRFFLFVALCLVPVPSASVQAQVDAVSAAREAEPVVLAGASLPSWSRLSAVGAPSAWPSGALDGVRDAHHGTLVVPPDPRTGVPVDEIAAYRFEDGKFVEVPVQVDERYPYFLANANSDFSLYSAVDEELGYAWDIENWKKTAGTCRTEYPPGEGPMPDPVAGLDNDDEIVFMASDAGARASEGARGPVGTGAERLEIAVVDPLNPGSPSYIYLFRLPGGSSFDATNGYVTYTRDADADQWIDRSFFPPGHPEMLGTSNTGYGPNLSGTVCPDGVTPKDSTDRFPRDGVTVTTDTYKWRATGRWMVRGMHVTKPGTTKDYGPDLIDRWKGRAFQQSPDSSISLVGFEDEQVNWEANSALIGERMGPVRAIRETWGADSGTNTTKTELFYRDAVQYHYHLRVHPVPLDGLYQSWDYNAGVADRYFNSNQPNGIAIDGSPDDAGNVDEDPVTGTPMFFDVPDPRMGTPLVTFNWQQVSGKGDAGSLVYVGEPKSPTSLENPAVVPYYNDDKCFDDGTGDDPVARPWPGEPGFDARVQAAYAEQAGKPYAEVTCDEKQGAWGAHGVHFLFVGETDNAFQSKPLTEDDIAEWQFAVPTGAPQAVGEPYANVIRAPLRAVAGPPQASVAMLESNLEITEPLSGDATDAVDVRARLTDDSGNAVPGATVRFDLQGESYDGTTNEDGHATARVRLAAPAGPTPLRATFAGDDTYAPSNDEESFTVAREDSTITFAAKRRTRQGMSKITLRLSDLDSGAAISGREVAISIDGRRRATVTTNAQGRATTRIRVPAKDSTISVRFAGDSTYLGSAASRRYDARSGAKGSSL